MISQKNYELWAEYDDRIENPSTRDAFNILRGAAAALDCFSVYPNIKGFLPDVRFYTPDVISYAVWLYYRFNLSHRDIEELLAERGITVS
jgi:hypothetical protein